MRQETEPSQATVKAAVEATLRGWGAELYVGQNFLVDGLESHDP